MRPHPALDLSIAWVLVLFLFLPVPARAQVQDSLPPGPTRQRMPDSVARAPDSIRTISPTGAFLRSALIPGWGHAKIGAQGRGAFYFAVESASVFMIFKTQSRLSLARDRLALEESIATRRLQAEGIEDLLELEAALAEDETVADLRGLEEARASQREDWVALSIFFLFLGGADAFVSAHLAEFPTPVEVTVEGDPRGRVEVGVAVPVGF